MKRLFFAPILLVCVANGFSRNWNGISPSVSTRADVEKKLGKRESVVREYGIYNFKRYSVHIEYSRQTHADDSSRDIVLVISVYPKKRFPISRVKSDLSRFKKITGENNSSGLAFYSDYKDGFTIQVQKPIDDKEELVTAFIYYSPTN